jgi:hypothetical protein
MRTITHAEAVALVVEDLRSLHRAVWTATHIRDDQAVRENHFVTYLLSNQGLADVSRRFTTGMLYAGGNWLRWSTNTLAPDVELQPGAGED